MAYCPQCFVEYREGASECADCQVPLVAGEPPAEALEEPGDVHMARVRTFTGPTAHLNADLARNVLEEAGIPAFIPGETSGEILPGIDCMQVLVRSDDSERASEILEAYFDASAENALPEEADEEPSRS